MDTHPLTNFFEIRHEHYAIPDLPVMAHFNILSPTKVEWRFANLCVGSNTRAFQRTLKFCVLLEFRKMQQVQFLLSCWSIKMTKWLKRELL